jgi:hypothetical protein
MLDKNILNPNLKFKKMHSGSLLTVDNQAIFKEINLNDIFLPEEIEKLTMEPVFQIPNEKNEKTNISITHQNEETGISTDLTRSSLNTFMCFDRNILIMKFMKACIERLTGYNENVLAKGLDW